MTSTEKTNRIADVNAAVAELLTRRDTRATDALAGKVPAASPAPSALLPVARRLSTAQLDIFRAYYPDGSGGIKFDDFQRGFEQFANGELRDPAVPGKREPNGGFFFLFAEFAFLCAASAIDVADWTKLLRIFVAAQEIFMHVYRPAPHARPPAVGARLPATGSAVRTLDDFKDSNFNTTGQSKEARKQALRTKYARMDLDALKHEARKNLLRALRMT